MRTVCGSEFQTDGAKNWKARPEKSVLVNGWTSSGMEGERTVRLQHRRQEGRHPACKRSKSRNDPNTSICRSWLSDKIVDGISQKTCGWTLTKFRGRRRLEWLFGSDPDPNQDPGSYRSLQINRSPDHVCASWHRPNFCGLQMLARHNEYIETDWLLGMIRIVFRIRIMTLFTRSA